MLLLSRSLLKMRQASLICLWVCLWSVWPLQPARADQVQLASRDDPGRTRTLHGTILDFTGRQLVLQTEAGQTRTLDAVRIRDVRTKTSDRHLAGDDAWRNHQWQQAASHYLQASRGEERAWVRRRIAQRLIRCYQALGRIEEAGTLFLLLARSDPATPAYAHMPLAWTPTERVSRRKGRQWLDQRELPPAMLLGASHLLSTDARAEALAILEQLRRPGDTQSDPDRPVRGRTSHGQSGEGELQGPFPEVAVLATAQSWRAHTDQLTEARCAELARQVETFPEPLRAGPYFVLGTIFRHLRQTDRAILFYMRLPILYGEQRNLAARALVDAAGLEEKRAHRPEAIRLLQEVVDRYPETEEHELARRLLSQWDPARGSSASEE